MVHAPLAVRVTPEYPRKALPGIGHACGHNLIAVAGVGIALAIRDALVRHDIAGKIILLGTPGMDPTAVPVADTSHRSSRGGWRRKIDPIRSRWIQGDGRMSHVEMNS
jgi:hypothetical protein